MRNHQLIQELTIILTQLRRAIKDENVDLNNPECREAIADLLSAFEGYMREQEGL